MSCFSDLASMLTHHHAGQKVNQHSAEINSSDQCFRTDIRYSWVELYLGWVRCGPSGMLYRIISITAVAVSAITLIILVFLVFRLLSV